MDIRTTAPLERRAIWTEENLLPNPSPLILPGEHETKRSLELCSEITSEAACEKSVVGVLHKIHLADDSLQQRKS